MARRRGINKKFLWPVILLAVIILFNFTPAGRAFVWLQEPMVKIGGKFFGLGRGARDFWRGLARGGYLQKELSKQEAEIAALAKANADLYNLENENRDLRALAGLKESHPEMRLLPADVIWINSGAGRSLLTINRGQADGVAENLPVLAADGVFIGKISSATAHSATVVLTTDRESAIAATSGRDQNLQAIVKGKIDLSLSLELIPQDALIEPGDIITTSSLEENTPPGLPLGRVAGVFYKEGELFKRANLEPLISIPALRAAAVLLEVN